MMPDEPVQGEEWTSQRAEPQPQAGVEAPSARGSGDLAPRPRLHLVRGDSLEPCSQPPKCALFGLADAAVSLEGDMRERLTAQAFDLFALGRANADDAVDDEVPRGNLCQCHIAHAVAVSRPEDEHMTPRFNPRPHTRACGRQTNALTLLNELAQLWQVRRVFEGQGSHDAMVLCASCTAASSGRFCKW